ncbi:hypothetical protein O3Q51_18255 [Cryomorphaceae bacterium 1068]|nr:hypothetical protein [Cryomorphaceae bacterium 1068]
MNRILYLFFFVALVSCQNEQQKIERTNGKTEWIDPNTIQLSPIIQDSLTSGQIEKISYLHNTFKEVDPTSREKWIEDFMRDYNPDNEIEIWMTMANAYNSYVQLGELNIEEKKEVYKILLMRSSAPADEVLSHIELDYLSEKEAKQVMQAYQLEAKPIRVSKE